MAIRSLVLGGLAGLAIGCQAPARTDLEYVIPSGTYQAMIAGAPMAGIPDRIVLSAGDSVRIRNEDQAIHSVAGELIWPGHEVRITFSERGEFRFRPAASCSYGLNAGQIVEVQ